MDAFFTDEGQYLVSASNDRTVRIWDVNTGKMSRIIRGQIGKGPEGTIYAAALSPDNKWLAVGGWMGTLPSYWMGKISAYMFASSNDFKITSEIRIYDFKTGQLTALLKGHTNVVTSLAFSKDSRFLASGSADDTVIIWNINTQKQLHILSGHSRSVYALSFLPNNRRLVSGAIDNKLILWDINDGSLIKKMTGHTGEVTSVAVSPDGKYIVSGSTDKTIRLWDGRNGNYIRKFAKQKSEVSGCSFSPNGKYILVGMVSQPFVCNLYEFPSGKKSYTFPKNSNIVMATAISPDSKLAATCGGENNEIYIWEIKTGKVRHKLVGNGRNIWNVGFGKDNMSISWGNNKHELQKWMKIPSSINNFNLEYKGDVIDKDTFIREEKSAGNYHLPVHDENYGYDSILEIKKNETIIASIGRDSKSGFCHTCYTFTPNQKYVVSGGMQGILTLYDTQTGYKVNEFIGHTGTIWSVAVSPDGKRLISGSGDQTIKLWNIESGENLITLFVGSDEEWVAWTISGYYTCSLYGDKYIGWQINQGNDKNPKYYGASQFAEILYRSDIVSSTLSNASEKKALTQIRADFTLTKMQDFAPPDVRILLPENGYKTTSDMIDMEISIDKVSAEINDIAIFVNNRQILASPQRRIINPKGGIKKRYPVPLELGENIIEVEVRNRKNAVSSAVINVIRELKNKIPNMNIARGNLNIISIGVNKLKNIKYNNLDFPSKDAQDIVNVMKTLEGKLFKKIYSTIFSDFTENKPISYNILDSLEELKSKDKNDTVMLFIAGHGVKTSDGEHIFLTQNAELKANGKYRISSVLKWSQIVDVFRKVNARRIIFLDTCYSGNLDITQMLKTGSDSNIIIFSSSTGSETSEERESLQNGIFTYAICKGLNREKNLPADMYKDGEIDITELAAYVKGEVRLLNKNQTPNLVIPVGVDFPFFVR